MYEVTAWRVETPQFKGIVYTEAVALKFLSQATAIPATVQTVWFYRDHKPLPHMTYRKIENV